MKKKDLMGLVQSNEYLVFDGEYFGYGLAVIFDRTMSIDHGEHKIKRMFKVLENDEVEELDVEKMVRESSEALVHTIDPLFLIKKVLGEMSPNDLIKTHKIVTEHPELAKKAKTLHHCLQIMIEDPQPGSENIMIPIRY